MQVYLHCISRMTRGKNSGAFSILNSCCSKVCPFSKDELLLSVNLFPHLSTTPKSRHSFGEIMFQNSVVFPEQLGSARAVRKSQFRTFCKLLHQLQGILLPSVTVDGLSAILLLWQGGRFGGGARKRVGGELLEKECRERNAVSKTRTTRNAPPMANCTDDSFFL